MSENENILRRVRKLLALANDAGAAEGERDNALRMAHKTLAAHNLSMAEVEAAGAAQQEARIQGKHQTIAHPWIRTIHYAVAQLNFCEYFYMRHRTSHVTHYIVGRESNCVSAREIAQFLCSAIQREASRRAREGFLDGGWARDFCKGAAHRIWARCKALREESERASEPQQPKAPGTALVLASVYASEQVANKALIVQLGHKLQEGASRERGAQEGAYHEGRNFGDSLSLHRQVGSGQSNKRLTNGN